MVLAIPPRYGAVRNELCVLLYIYSTGLICVKLYAITPMLLFCVLNIAIRLLTIETVTGISIGKFYKIITATTKKQVVLFMGDLVSIAKVDTVI